MSRFIVALAVVGLVGQAAYGQKGEVISYNAQVPAGTPIEFAVPKGGFVLTDVVVLATGLSWEIDQDTEAKLRWLSVNGSLHLRSGIPFDGGASLRVSHSDSGPHTITLSGYIPSSGGEVVSFYAMVAEGETVPFTAPSGGFVLTDVVVLTGITLEIDQDTDGSAKLRWVSVDGSLHLRSGIPFDAGATILVRHNNSDSHRITLSGYIPGCPTCSADMNADCTVDAFDLATLLGSWGPCL